MALLVGVAAALLPTATAEPSCTETAGEACYEQGEGREGGSCDHSDGERAHNTKYYNASYSRDEASVDARWRFTCKDQQASTQYPANRDEGYGGFVIETPGRRDYAATGYAYGYSGANTCSAWLLVHPDRILIFTGGWGVGAGELCPFSSHFPSATELLP